MKMIKIWKLKGGYIFCNGGDDLHFTKRKQKVRDYVLDFLENE